jgi:hypothetical protein
MGMVNRIMTRIPVHLRQRREALVLRFLTRSPSSVHQNGQAFLHQRDPYFHTFDHELEGQMTADVIAGCKL